MPFIDILIFAVIALFLIFRLRSILGGREGFEKPQPKSKPQSAKDNVINFKDQSSVTEPIMLNGSGLKDLRKMDPSFKEDEFLDGAKAAFSLILGAFAEGNVGELRRYLGFDLYEEFSGAIHQRNSAGEILKIDVEKVKDVQLLDSEIIEGIATVSVKYVTVQSRTLTDASDNIIDEDSVSSETIEDIWVFERDIRSSDPNWRLVETGTAEND
ncbi:Tim44/TimA family putative adaptor protein [Alphaproteobacteria bacterium]|nr:Tim44 domain-containing protein [Alphaproteobacteria bacterium]MBT5798659.1 Tim44 domain-containing protein [Alphaproteobacteria bacterium]MDA9190221.1 Tim44/TimA family putative adaptor protein [Alphaproteobacteria bacterium]MDC0462002.1 Tim44/TimA family putative adaptor protein [Alphaproteobacteria bacterium]